MDLLVLLVERRHELVTRDEIAKCLWGERAFVDVEMGVNTAMRKVRQVLEDPADSPLFIQTVPARGYRFVAEVERVEPSATAPPRCSRLAVLPFENIGSNPEREYFADGLTEEAIVALGQIDPERLVVLGRTAVMPYKRTTKPPEQIGRELNVEYLVEGAVRGYEGTRMRISAKLIRVCDQSQVWSLSLDNDGERILDFQRELCVAIAEKAALQITPGGLDRLSRRQTRDAEAYDLYLRGRYYWNQLTPPTTRRAIEYYMRATQRDPRYALAWSGLTDAHASAPINGDAPPLQAAEHAHAAARRAQDSDAQLAEVQASLGMVQLFLDWDWPAAEAHFRRAIALDPAYAFGHRMLGVVLTHRGQHEDARVAMRRARELEIYGMHYSLSSMIEIHARNPQVAIEFARQATAIAPDLWVGHYHLSHAYELAGELELALESVNIASRLSGGNSKALGTRGYLLAKMGNEREAREVLTGMEAISRERFLPPYGMALTLLGLGEDQRALECLERACEIRDVGLIFLPVDPKWDRLRSNTRLQEVIRRCGFR